MALWYALQMLSSAHDLKAFHTSRGTIEDHHLQTVRKNSVPKFSVNTNRAYKEITWHASHSS